MAAIGFVDLLASKDSALVSAEDFSNSINAFHKALLDNVEELGEGFKIRFFADCCYLECQKAELIVKFFQVVRNNLFSRNLFFKAALGVGSLDDRDVGRSYREENGIEAGSIEGTSFGADVVEIYLNAEQFKGIGVFINNKFIKLLSEEVGQERVKEYIISSAYFPDERSLILEKYFDLALDLEEKEGNFGYMPELMAAFEEAKILKKKYARYYFPILLLWIHSASIEENDIQETENGKYSINKNKYIYKYFFAGGDFSARFHDIPQYSSVYLSIIDRYISTGADDRKILYMIQSLPAKKKVFKELDDVPVHIMPYAHKRKVGKLLTRYAA